MPTAGCSHVFWDPLCVFVFGVILVPAYVAMLKRGLDAPKHLRIVLCSRKKLPIVLRWFLANF